MSFQKEKKRGRSFDKRLIQDGMRVGLSVSEIASSLGTTSLQSVRHAMEKLRSDYSEQNLQVEIIENPVGFGLPIYADEETLSSFIQLIENIPGEADFCTFPYPDHSEMYVPFSISSKKWRQFLLKKGYYLEVNLKSSMPAGCDRALLIGAKKSSPTELINLDNPVKCIFHTDLSKVFDEVKLSLRESFINGNVKFRKSGRRDRIVISADAFRGIGEKLDEDGFALTLRKDYLFGVRMGFQRLISLSGGKLHMVDQHDEDTYMELLKAAMVLKNQGSKHFREGEAEILIRDVIRESIGYYPISIPYDRLKEVAPLLNPFKNSLEPFADLLIDPE